jgi:phage shock protein E
MEDCMTRWLPLLLVLAVSVAACDAAPETNAAATAEAPAPVATSEAAATNGDAAGVVYVDVRTPEEFAEGHVVGAINIPHTEMRARHDELDEYAGEEIVLYCRSGRRSGIAQRVLQEEGFTNVENGGGLSDLHARGVPTTR